ncbi:MAG TPA: ABC transporter permease [Steroidobacteraceae bacterium]|nr:ABC transporter permease [Steroidobacteraceae bacterium]
MRFVRRKLLHLIPILLIVTFVTFALLNLLPGDVSLELLGSDATPSAIARVRAELRLDDPLVVRYLRWLGQALRGDLGRSFITGEPVMAALARSLPVSIELMALSLLLSLSLAVPAGLLAAYRAGQSIDKLLSALAALLLSAPSFMLGLVLMFFLALTLKWLPAVGYVPLSEGILGNLRSFAIPVLTLALVEWPVFMRILRSDAIVTLQQDYVLLAKAKGLRNVHILFRHVLKPSSFTLITVAGLTVATLIGGALVVETIFALPGVGRLLIGSINSRDFMMVQGAVALIAVGFVLVNFAIDTLYSVLDPRVAR